MQEQSPPEAAAVRVVVVRMVPARVVRRLPGKALPEEIRALGMASIQQAVGVVLAEREL
jgi:hypothetical protein